MSEYQVLARKYRPKSFHEVVGQDPIITTLINAIKNHRLAHAYLFCGSRGTGKTTIARLFAKALNCINPNSNFEPCNICASCKEITGGNSLDVLEIDGASHRGIDDIRQINDTVAYATASGKYKIYIIDEVHMLTKEAFNALLKTLEEPPLKVKFLFATTEPQKVLPTILSRCQRFNLSRIPPEKILEKLQSICTDLDIKFQEEALRIIATRAEGGLRDAESLLDQIIAFHEGEITTDIVTSILGIMSRDSLFEFDFEGKKGNLAFAFEMAHQVFSQGKDLVYFVETLSEHFRNILLVKLSGKNVPFLSLSETERNRYEDSAKLYSQEQCLTILDLLVEAQNQIRFAPSGKTALEALLLRIIRTHHRVPIEVITRKLTELEHSIKNGIEEKNEGTELSSLQPAEASSRPVNTQPQPPIHPEPMQPQPPLPLQPEPPQPQPPIPIQPEPPQPQPPLPIKPEPPQPQIPPPTKPEPLPLPTQPEPIQPIQQFKEILSQISMNEDPTPSAEDLGLKKKSPNASEKQIPKSIPASKQSRYDTILQFAAVELEGTIKK